MDESEASRVFLQEVIVDPKVLDLLNVDESLEKEALEHTHWQLEADEQNTKNYDAEKQAQIASLLNMETCGEVSREDTTQMGLNILKSGLSPKKLRTLVRVWRFVSLLQRQASRHFDCS